MILIAGPWTRCASPLGSGEVGAMRLRHLDLKYADHNELPLTPTAGLIFRAPSRLGGENRICTYAKK